MDTRESISIRIATKCARGIALLSTLLFLNTVSMAQTDEASSWTDWLSGELESGIDIASSDLESDIELYQVLRLNIRPPDERTWRIRTTVWTIEDLDGNEDPTSVLRSINDASNEAVQVRVLSLYYEQKSPHGKSTTRVGRQRIVDGIVYNRIDGVYTKYAGPTWSWYAFGGARASLYEDAHNDFASGGGVSTRLPTRTRIDADLFYGEDERRLFGTDNLETSVFSLTLAQPLNRYHRVFGRATWNEDRLDEFRVAAQGFFPESEITYSLTYRKRLSILTERVSDVSNFYGVFGELNEYEDISVIVVIPIGVHYGLDLQVQTHDASNSTLVFGNRDYQRYAASLNLYNLPEEGVDATLTVEFWNADFGEGQWTVTGEVKRTMEHAHLAVGADFERFEDRVSSFDPALQTVLFVETHENIYSLYARLRYEINEKHSIGVRTSVQQDDGADSPYLRMRASYTVRF